MVWDEETNEMYNQLVLLASLKEYSLGLVEIQGRSITRTGLHWICCENRNRGKVAEAK